MLALVADALDYAHHQGVVHRDVKPANVLMTSTDSAQAFGLRTLDHCLLGRRREIGCRSRHATLHEPRANPGGTKLDYRTDLYSLGIMIYESATGSVPFTGPSVAIMSQHYSVAPDPPRSRNPLVSRELEALILSLLAKRPMDRPASGGSVAQALRDEMQRAKETAGAVADGACEHHGHHRLDRAVADGSGARHALSGRQRTGSPGGLGSNG